MPVFFQGAVGRTIRLDDQATSGSLHVIDMLGAQVRFESHRSVITRVTVDQAVNAQLQHMLGGSINVFVFGDRAGQIIVSGLSFSSNCQDEVHGLERMLDWYAEFKASANESPVRCMIGETAFDGVLLRMTGDVVDPATGMAQWTGMISTFPEPKKGP